MRYKIKPSAYYSQARENSLALAHKSCNQITVIVSKKKVRKKLYASTPKHFQTKWQQLYQRDMYSIFLVCGYIIFVED